MDHADASLPLTENGDSRSRYINGFNLRVMAIRVLVGSSGSDGQPSNERRSEPDCCPSGPLIGDSADSCLARGKLQTHDNFHDIQFRQQEV
jgi:hypothetical protein